MSSKEDTSTEFAFGPALSELETIVAQLEGGQLELEDSLALYERGVALLRALQGRLAQAQQQVTMLVGELETDQNSDEQEAL